jgi:hypothetical protein
VPNQQQIGNKQAVSVAIVSSLDRIRTMSEERELHRFERWGTDWKGDPIIEWDSEAHERWLEKWAPNCPNGYPQRVRHALGFRERSVGELELRVPLGGDDGGVCEVVVDELDDEVHVRVIVCYDPDDEEAAERPRTYVDWPVRVWLERPLGDRAVIDVDTDEELKLFKLHYDNGVRQPDHGYHPANRRQRRRDV